MNRKSGASRPKKQTPALSVEGLSKAYGEIVALDDVDLEVPVGQSVVLVGHNGSGKSTLLNLAAGNLEPTGGRVRVNGQPPDSMHARARRSWLPDTPVLYDDLSVREHMEYVSRMHGASGEDPLLDELVERLGLADREDQLPSQFSRGLRQKAAIVVALCRPFSILLVDEPFVGLDAAGRKALLEMLDETRENGATVIVATHDPAVIERFERGVLMSNGELIHDGPASDLPKLLTDEVHGA